MNNMKRKTSSGTDVNRGISYQKCCVLRKFLKEFENQDFLKIIIESPENEIEDINCVLMDKVEFIQIKKKEGDRWTKSNLKEEVFKLFVKIFKTRYKITYY